MLKIGNKKVLLSTTILVPDGEDAEFFYELASDDLLHCKFKFIHDESNVADKKTFAQSSYEDNAFVITFHNFNTSLGQTFSLPLNFAVTNKGESIELLSSVYKLGKLTKADIQITVEEIQ